MLTKTRGIVLKCIKYSEASVVAKIYTEELGLQSYMINSVRSGKGAIKPSHLQLLNLLELDVYHKSNQQLHRIKEIRCAPKLTELHYNIVKSTVGLFMAEVVTKAIQEEETNPALFEFLFNMVQYLDLEHQSLANFPAYFMIQLTRHLGFFPTGRYDGEHNAFDLVEGTFNNRLTLTGNVCIDGNEASQFSELINTDLEFNHSLQIPKANRTNILNHLIRYYQIHLDQFGEIKSIGVIRDTLA